MKSKFKVPMSKPDIGKKEIGDVLKTLKSDWPSQGNITKKFELSLSRYFSSNAIVVNNGSSALMCALLANGIKPGDKIIVPSFTFIATSSVAKILGAKILLADINPETFNIDPESVEKIVKKHNVKMVIGVDVGGLPIDIEKLTNLSKQYKFKLIEDAAEAFGSKYKNKKIGSFNHTTIFSFQIAKQITTIEGGAVTSGQNNILKKVSQIKDYGRSEAERYVHDEIGMNFRTTDLQSAIGLEQLKKAEKNIQNRIKIASMYKKKIKGIQFQKIPKNMTRHSYMLFFALAQNKKERDSIISNLTHKGIDARKSWLPMNLQPCNPELRNFSYENAKLVYDRAFTLPIYNSMTLKEAELVIDSFKI